MEDRQYCDEEQIALHKTATFSNWSKGHPVVNYDKFARTKDLLHKSYQIFSVYAYR
jgi:hypothetical protein